MSPEEPRWRSLIGQIRAVQMELKRRSTERVVGLEERFGELRSDLNQDLENIEAFYLEQGATRLGRTASQ